MLSNIHVLNWVFDLFWLLIFCNFYLVSHPANSLNLSTRFVPDLFVHQVFYLILVFTPISSFPLTQRDISEQVRRYWCSDRRPHVPSSSTYLSVAIRDINNVTFATLYSAIVPGSNASSSLSPSSIQTSTPLTFTWTVHGKSTSCSFLPRQSCFINSTLAIMFVNVSGTRDNFYFRV